MLCCSFSHCTNQGPTEEEPRTNYLDQCDSQSEFHLIEEDAHKYMFYLLCFKFCRPGQKHDSEIDIC